MRLKKFAALSLALLLALLSCSGARAEDDAFEVRPAKLPAAQFTVNLNGVYDDYCIGANGRYLIFYLKEQKKLYLFDVSEPTVARQFPLNVENILFTAGARLLVIAVPAEQKVETFGLDTLKFKIRKQYETKHQMEQLVLGSASDGPLLIGLSGYQENSRFYGPRIELSDPASLKTLNCVVPRSFRVNPDKASHIRASADGRVFGCWRLGTSPMGFQTLHFKGSRLEAHYEHASKGYLAPGERGQLVYCSDGVYDRLMKPIDDEQQFLKKESFPIPAVHGPFYLRVSISERGTKAPATVAIHRNDNPSPLVTLNDVKLRPPTVSDRWGKGRVSFDRRLLLIPKAKVLITLPESNDKIVVRRFDFEEELKKSGQDYLAVLSQPPGQISVGEKLQYQVDVKSKQGGVKYQLSSAPAGMTISPDGQVQWSATSRPFGGAVSATCTVSDASGKSVDHPFVVRVERPAQEIEKTGGYYQYDQNTLEIPDGPFSVVTSRQLQSLLVVQGSRVAVVAPDGISLKAVQRLKKDYAFVRPRPGYLVAVSHNPRSVDIVDSRSLEVTKSLKLEHQVLDVAQHPRLPISYIAIKESFDVPGCKFLVFDERTAKAKTGETFVGARLTVDPNGRYLVTGYSDIYRRGSQLLVNPTRLHVVPRYGSFAWLLGFELGRDGTPTLKQLHPEAGGNQLGLRFSGDGTRVSNVNTWRLVGWNPADFDDEPVVYQAKADAAGYDLDYHPVLPLVACIAENKPVLLNRDTGEALDNRLEFTAPDGAKLHRLYFSLDGRNLIADLSVNDVHYLRRAKLDLSAQELQKLKQLAGGTPPVAARPAEKVPLAEFEALRGGLGRKMTPRDVARWFTNSVVVIKSRDGNGSGFVVGSRGYILSCAHCIPVDNKVTVAYRVGAAGETETKLANAKVLSVDDDLDLALLKIDVATPLRPVRLAPMTNAETGEQVYIISNPGLGDKTLDATMTEGIVSNPRRLFDGVPLIQTSAAVNPGSSGGPVFNSRGLVTGLVAVKGRIEAAGFAVPSPLLTKFLVDAAKTTGPDTKLQREWYDATLAHRIQAVFQDVRDGNVVLKKADGTEVAVPSDKLSKSDQAFVRLLSGKE